MLLCALAMLSGGMYAQRKSISLPRPEQQFNGFVIRVYNPEQRKYNYDILKNNQLVVHQVNNPFTGKPGGLSTYDDALKLAKWQTVQLSMPGGETLYSGNTIPLTVAKQLSIPVE